MGVMGYSWERLLLSPLILKLCFQEMIFSHKKLRDLNDQAQKCRMSEFAWEGMKSQISPGNALYKTYIPKLKKNVLYMNPSKKFQKWFQYFFGIATQMQLGFN